MAVQLSNKSVMQESRHILLRKIAILNKLKTGDQVSSTSGLYIPIVSLRSKQYNPNFQIHTCTLCYTVGAMQTNTKTSRLAKRI